MWYKDCRLKHWMMFKDYENNIQYGIDVDKLWYSGGILAHISDSEYLASNKEIEKGLRKEAKRRGFVEGIKFLGCEGDDKNKELTIDEIKFHTPETGVTWGLYCGNSWIFVNGSWGTVVDEEEFLLDEQAVFGFKYNYKPDFNFKNKLNWVTIEEWKQTYYYHNSENHGANFYEVIKEIETKVDSVWKTFVIYKQLGSGLEFSREKEEFYNKFKEVYV